MKRLVITIFFAGLLVSGCTDETPFAPSEDDLVVRAYLYAGEPVEDIQITSTLPLGSQETVAPPVNDAQVTLLKNGREYVLVPSAGNSGYYHYAGSDLVVESGDEFEIRVAVNSRQVTAITTVPFPPNHVQTSSTELLLPDFSTRPGPGSGIGPGGRLDDSTRFIILNWQEDATALFYVVVENAEENPEPVSSFPGMGEGGMRRRLVFPPTNHNEFRITLADISYYGKHLAKIYRVNQEYADLYQSRNQDSRDLNEPLTNIEGGLGVFSAFASTAVEFNVK
jgi:hypothetical protein